MSTAAQLGVLAGVAFIGVLIAIDTRLRPAWFILLYAVANLADFGFVASSIGLGSTSVTLSDLLLAGAVLTLAVNGRAPQHAWPATAGPLVVFMLIGFLQIGRGASSGIAAAFAEGRFVLFPLAWFCAYAASSRIKDPARILTLTVAVISAVSASGIVIYVASNAVNLEFSHVPGRLAGYAVLGVALLVSGLVPSARRFRPIALGVLGLFLLVSGSKQALALLPLLYVVRRRTSSHPKTGAILASLAVLLVGAGVWLAAGTADSRPADTLRGYETTLRDPLADGGLSWRLSYWEALIDETPTQSWVTGVGIRPYFSDLQLKGFNGDVADTPHNSLIVMTLLGGIPLTAAYSIAIAAALRRYRDQLVEPRLADMALFVLILGHAMILFNAEHRLAGAWPLMWIMLGFFDALIDRDRSTPVGGRQRQQVIDVAT